MRYLLDTHIVIWSAFADMRLRPAIRDILADAAADLHFSVASVWEAEIKRQRGRLDFPEPMAAIARNLGLKILPISANEAEAAAWLPPHHADPFDRLLIAQARLHDLTLVSADGVFARYDVRLMRA